MSFYFTDHEPESCFTAVIEDQIVGYIFGARSIQKMRTIFLKKILPTLFSKVWRCHFFLRKENRQLAGHLFWAWLHGDFRGPDLTDSYPAVLHINIVEKFRGQRIGEKLIAAFLLYLKTNGVPGVHLHTASPAAKKFFLKQGFRVLWERPVKILNVPLARPAISCYMGREC